MKWSGYSGLYYRILLALCILVHADVWAKESFIIKNVETRLVEGHYLLNSDIQYQFSRQAIEALTNGVPMPVLVQIAVLKKRKYLWDMEVHAVKYRSVLHYYALTDFYRVEHQHNGEKLNFYSLDSALEELGKLRDLPVINEKKLQPNVVYKVKMQSKIDVEALPLPLRPKAYFSSSWRLYSEWFVWQLGR